MGEDMVRGSGMDHPFEQQLSVSKEDIEFELRGHGPVPWVDFWLNPRRLRGADFLMRWSQGEWSERRLVEAVNGTGDFLCYPYGPSGVAPDDVREYELYFERLEAAGLGQIKRPDLLIFKERLKAEVEAIIARLGGIEELPFLREDHPDMRALLDHAIIAVECENSLWRARQMPDYGVPMKSQKWLNGGIGMRKAAVLPTVIIKEQDLAPLRQWQEQAQVPIHIWHSFFDQAYGLSLTRAIELIQGGQIVATSQTFQAPSGATTTKNIYKIYYHYAYPLGVAIEEPSLKADAITDKNGHILPFVVFEGGKLQISDEALDVLEGMQR
ncbi:MAG: AccI family restriction endonuclease [Thermomicrobiales bacterium]